MCCTTYAHLFSHMWLAHALRYKTELNFFRMWSAQAERAMHLSGVSADEVREKVTTHWR